MEFDVCFCCNDDILFIKEGWDLLYRDVMERTGYDHLNYYDQNWNTKFNLPEPMVRGQLCSSGPPESIQGCFFTLTPEVIRTIGYFDTVNFGFRGLEHVDYTWRCCRAGFNAPDMIFDVLNSNDYIITQKDNYILSIPVPLQTMMHNAFDKKRKWQIIRMNRLFIPKNEINVMPEILEKHEKGEDISELLHPQRKTSEVPREKEIAYPGAGK